MVTSAGGWTSSRPRCDVTRQTRLSAAASTRWATASRLPHARARRRLASSRPSTRKSNTAVPVPAAPPGAPRRVWRPSSTGSLLVPPQPASRTASVRWCAASRSARRSTRLRRSCRPHSTTTSTRGARRCARRPRACRRWSSTHCPSSRPPTPRSNSATSPATTPRWFRRSSSTPRTRRLRQSAGRPRPSSTTSASSTPSSSSPMWLRLSARRAGSCGTRPARRPARPPSRSSTTPPRLPPLATLSPRR
mmetsp:Transcript_25423/g.58600  ORF Transcript_25423/g.58600 Transcript_25423/m.58600 type:complete len:249 (-) Transcript_25423:314-1060(-)